MASIDFSDVRLVSAGGVRHKVVEGVSISGDDTKLSATLGVVIQAEDLLDFIDEMFPQPEIIAGGALIGIQPRMYLANAPYMRAKSFTADPFQSGLPCDPFGADPNAAEETYSKLMKVVIQFETMQETDDEEPDPENPETFLDHSVQAGAEFLQLPPSMVTTSESDSMCPPCQDPANAQEPPNFEANKDPQLGLYKIIPTIEHNLRWKFVVNPNWTQIVRTLGKVNSSQIRIFNNAARETVLFTGISGQRSYRYFRRRISTTPWSLDFRFSQRCVFENGNATKGWNHVYSPSKGWVKVKRQDGSYLYEEENMLTLFSAG